ncbi:MAG: hypothetical protein ABFS02_11130 [Pseudomonadota bacterium]
MVIVMGLNPHDLLIFAIEVTCVSGIEESVRAGLGIGFAPIQALRHKHKGFVARRINPPTALIWHWNIIAPRPRPTRAFFEMTPIQRTKLTVFENERQVSLVDSISCRKKAVNKEPKSKAMRG